MAVVFSDLIDEASIIETDGHVVESTRLFYVFGLTFDEQGGEDPLTKYNDAGAAAGVPSPGALHPIYTWLQVRERELIPMDPGTMQIRVKYRNLLAHQVPPGTTWEISGDTTSEQIEDQFDRARSLVIVTRGNDENNVEEQTGNLRVWVPKRTLQMSQVLRTSNPGIWGSTLVGRTNLLLWQGGVKNTWLCTGAPFRYLGPGDEIDVRPNWEVGLKFAYNDKKRGLEDDWPDPVAGWQPQVIFIDPNTGRPAANLSGGHWPSGKGRGYFTVDYYETYDFNLLEP